MTRRVLRTTNQPNVKKPPFSDKRTKRLVDLSACVEFLEKTDNLVRINSEVDPNYVLAGIAKKFEGEKCLLFNRVKGSEYPVVIGLLWNRDIVGSLFGVAKEKVPFVIIQAIEGWRKNKGTISSPLLDKGPANEVIEKKLIFTNFRFPFMP